MELHRLFDRGSENKVYYVCMAFSSFKRDINDDIFTHITTENLTNQLSTFEKALKSSTAGVEQEVLTTTSRKVSDKPIGKEAKHVTGKSTFICYYCKKPDHIVRNCRKWVEDVKPPLRRGKSEDSHLEVSDGAVEGLMAATASLASDDEDHGWYINNGATNHVTNQRDVFTTFEIFSVTHSIKTENGEAIQAVGKGSVMVAVDTATALRCLVCPTTQQKPVFVEGQLKWEGIRRGHGGLYKILFRIAKLKEIASITHKNSIQLYHERLRHRNKRYVKRKILEEFRINNLQLDNELCERCIYENTHRLKFGQIERAMRPGELIHSDVCGPFPHTLSIYLYADLFKDDFSRFCSIYYMRQKSEVPENDNGGEFDSCAVREILRENGINLLDYAHQCKYTSGSLDRNGEYSFLTLEPNRT
ncbi:hypothetical protein PR048_018555 [Dryococelus australis]|uniref:CCHC-type domain-containing protein n=1 Tax=Dryococelus australis TaxID=614101 RepID=A0ABQ9HCT1_9NEOP|nr:hypothetical protein PR048_018555 [Dryococelus australis]